MPYGNKKPKKMGCSGGGPNMYKVGSKEKNTPMNFSDKAMKYMKNMPAMYKNKPMMESDPEKKKPAAKDNILGSVHRDAYGKQHIVDDEQYVEIKEKEFVATQGQAALDLRRAKSSLEKIRKKGPAGRSKEEIKAYQNKIKSTQARIEKLESKKKTKK